MNWFHCFVSKNYIEDRRADNVTIIVLLCLHAISASFQVYVCYLVLHALNQVHFCSVIHCKVIVWFHHFFGGCVARRIKEIVAQNKGNTVLELQQRSIEFSSIIQRHQSIKWVPDSYYWGYFCVTIFFILKMVIWTMLVYVQIIFTWTHACIGWS